MICAELSHLVELVDFQAGGGGSFGGGGGGGGGFGGGGDGDGIGYLIYFLIRLAIEYPPIGVPLLIVIAVAFTMGSKRGWWKHQERTIRRSRPVRTAYTSRVWADMILRMDPEFQEPRFLQRVEAAFHKAQTSWCEQSLEPLRPFVSDGVFERFSLQIEEQKQDGWRQGMLGLRVGSLELVHVETGSVFDTVTVRIPFRADIHRLALADGKKISGSALPRNWFSECWSFVRRRGARSLAGEGLIEGKCPNCAAPLTMNQSARCTHCECLARSGEFDWVLAEITQTSEWRAESERQLPGLQAFAQRDPGMNVQLLEDRASVAFWRKCAADRAASIDPLTRVGDEEFCRRYAEHLAAAASGERQYMADCAVGSVRSLGILPAAEAAKRGRDRAVVEIVWDGRLATVKIADERRLAPRRTLRRSLFVFGRRAGVQTRLEETFTTAHCGTCGAHDPGGTDPACPYCGTPRTGGKTSWLLEQVVPANSSEAARFQAELAAASRAPETQEVPESEPRPESAAGLLTWAVALVQEDHRVSADERAAVLALAEHGEVPPERVDELLEAPDNSEAVPRPRDEREARAWLATLARIAMADGKITSGERRFLRRAAELLGVGQRELDRELEDARARLYRESREAKRSATTATR